MAASPLLRAAEKTITPIAMPILPQLQVIIEQSPVGKITLIARHDGLLMAEDGFGKWFSDASRAVGAPGSCHGYIMQGLCEQLKVARRSIGLLPVLWTPS